MSLLEGLPALDIAHQLGWMLLHSLWLLLIPAGLAMLLLMVIPKRMSAPRYVVCVASLTLMLGAFTFAAAIVPERDGPMRTAAAQATAERANELAAAPHVGNDASRTGETDASKSPVLAEKPLKTRDHPNSGRVSSSPGEAATRATTEPATGPTASWPAQLAGSAERWFVWMVPAWLAGVFALGVWHLGGLIAVYRLRSVGTRPAPPEAAGALEGLLKVMRVRKPVALLESALVQSPVVIGWIKPVVLIPASMFTGMTPQQIESVLAHELAHIRRHDYLVNLIQRLIVTLLFYHPAVWWVSRQICNEREYCCDDIVVETTGRKLDYAQALAQIAQRQADAPAGYTGLAMAASGGSVLSRIQRIAGVEDAGGMSTKAWLAGLFSIACVIAMPTLLVAYAEATSQAQPTLAATELAVIDQATPVKSVNRNKPLTVAVLGFEAPGQTDDSISKTINDVIEALISTEDQFQVVNHNDIEKAIQEQSLVLSEATKTNQAITIGRMAGAKLLVTGKAFKLGENWIMTAKLISSETTKVKAVMARGELDEPLDKLVFEVATKLVEQLDASGQDLVASSIEADSAPRLMRGSSALRCE